MQHRAGVQKQIHETGIGLRGFVSERCHSNGRINALDIEGVFERDGQTMKRPEGMAGFGEMAIKILRAL